MKVYVATLLTVLGISATVTAFVAPRSIKSCSTSSTCHAASSLDEEFATAFQEDDFYADYDPSKYDSRANDDGSSGRDAKLGLGLPPRIKLSSMI